MKKRTFILFYLILLLVFTPLAVSNAQSIYTVQEGDSLFSISQKFKTTIAKITELNLIPDPSLIFIDQKLEIPDEKEDISDEEEIKQEQSNENKATEKIDRSDEPAIFFRGSDDQSEIALTFDDGPDLEYTPQVLEILDDYNIKATFFLLGSQVERYPEVVEAIYQAGHIIANHTWSHPDLRKLDEQEIAKELKKTDDAIEEIIGKRTTLLRAPYGFISNDNLDYLATTPYRLIHWSVDSLDWRAKDKQFVIDNVLDNLHPGANILLHSATGEGFDLQPTVDALPTIIETIKAQNMEFVTIDQLFSIPAYQ